MSAKRFNSDYFAVERTDPGLGPSWCSGRCERQNWACGRAKKGLVGGRLNALCKAVRGPNGPCTDCVSGGGDLAAQLTDSVVVVLLVQEATTAKLN
jgi:hypothetical protein